MGPVLTLTLAYTLPLALFALILMGKHRPQRRIILLIALLPVFYYLHYSGLKSLTGWASTSEPPAEFDLLYEHIVEPNRAKGEEGVIYLWISTVQNRAPRAYRLDYSEPLHREIAAASERRNSGKTQIGQKRPSQARPDGAKDDSGTQSPYRFSNRNDSGLPPKNDS